MYPFCLELGLNSLPKLRYMPVLPGFKQSQYYSARCQDTYGLAILMLECLRDRTFTAHEMGSQEFRAQQVGMLEEHAWLPFIRTVLLDNVEFSLFDMHRYLRCQGMLMKPKTLEDLRREGKQLLFETLLYLLQRHINRYRSIAKYAPCMKIRDLTAYSDSLRMLSADSKTI